MIKMVIFGYMKKLHLSTFLFLISFSVFSQSGVQFTTPIVVASGTTYGYTKPKITLDANNNPVVLWGKAGTHELFVATFNGSGFNAPVQINPVGTHPYIASYYNADLKSNGDTIVSVFATDMPANRTFFVRSVDGGNTWSDTVRVDQIPAGGIAYFPSVDLNENGKVAVTFMRHEAGWANPRYVVTTSLDGGNTFLPDTNASAIAPGEVCDCCPAEMIYEGNRQVLLFRNNDANTREFYASVSNDNGTSFNGINIDNQGWVYPACPSVAPSALMSGDSLITVFMSGVTGANRLYISTTSLAGMVNGNVFMVDDVVPASTQQTQPQIAGKDSIMGLVWANTIPGAADVYFRFSPNGALGLIGDGINISNPTTGSQQNPDIAYANGNFHIVYQNTATQEVYYLKATMDEYIGIEPAEDLKYVLYQMNGVFRINLLNSSLHSELFQVYDVSGKSILSGKPQDNMLEFDMNAVSHGLYWIKIDGLNKIIKFVW
jgi:hypothetical protein